MTQVSMKNNIQRHDVFYESFLIFRYSALHCYLY